MSPDEVGKRRRGLSNFRDLGEDGVHGEKEEERVARVAAALATDGNCVAVSLYSGSAAWYAPPILLSFWLAGGRDGPPLVLIGPCGGLWPIVLSTGRRTLGLKLQGG